MTDIPDGVGRAIVAFIGALPSDKDSRNCFDYEWNAAMTAALETLLDPSEEAVRAAAHALAETDGMPGTYDDMARACLRAYHMTILGREPDGKAE